MSFTPIPITSAGRMHVHADGVMVSAADGSVGMFFSFDAVDALKVVADSERRLQVSEGRLAAVHA